MSASISVGEHTVRVTFFRIMLNWNANSNRKTPPENESTLEELLGGERDTFRSELEAEIMCDLFSSYKYWVI